MVIGIAFTSAALSKIVSPLWSELLIVTVTVAACSYAAIPWVQCTK